MLENIRESFNEKFQKLSKENKDIKESIEQITNLLIDKYKPSQNFMNDFEDVLYTIITETSTLSYFIGIDDGSKLVNGSS